MESQLIAMSNRRYQSGMRPWLCYLDRITRHRIDGMMPRQSAARYTRFPHRHNDKNHRRNNVMPFTTAVTGARDAPASALAPAPECCRAHGDRSGAEESPGIYILERAPRHIKSPAPCKSLANHRGTGSGTTLAAQRWHDEQEEEARLDRFRGLPRDSGPLPEPAGAVSAGSRHGSFDAGANFVNPHPNQDDDTPLSARGPSLAG
jgi:hypothetical protein